MAETDINELVLQGNVSNLNRAKKREDNTTPLTPGRKEEIAALDSLIVQTMKSCRKGNVRNKKSNPAYSHLALLVRVREALLRGHSPAKGSASDALAELNAALGRAN